jgi:hypothetical protein
MIIAQRPRSVAVLGAEDGEAAVKTIVLTFPPHL